MKRRDLAANVNWFSKVAVDEAGVIGFDPSAAKPGATVELRFEMDTLVLFHTCPHPLDPAAELSAQDRSLRTVRRPSRYGDDACRLSAPENGRGFENNRIFHACGCH